MSTQVVEAEKKRINIAKDWIVFLYALFPLDDGEHVVIIRKEAGKLVDWRPAKVGKAQSPKPTTQQKAY